VNNLCTTSFNWILYFNINRIELTTQISLQKYSSPFKNINSHPEVNEVPAHVTRFIVLSFQIPFASSHSVVNKSAEKVDKEHEYSMTHSVCMCLSATSHLREIFNTTNAANAIHHTSMNYGARHSYHTQGHLSRIGGTNRLVDFFPSHIVYEFYYQ